MLVDMSRNYEGEESNSTRSRELLDGEIIAWALGPRDTLASNRVVAAVIQSTVMAPSHFEGNAGSINVLTGNGAEGSLQCQPTVRPCTLLSVICDGMDSCLNWMDSIASGRATMHSTCQMSMTDTDSPETLACSWYPTA